MFYNLTKKLSHPNGHRIKIQHGDIFIYKKTNNVFLSYICFDKEKIKYPEGSGGAWGMIVDKNLVNLYHHCIKFEDFNKKINNEYIQNKIYNRWNYYGYPALSKEEWLDPNWRKSVEMKAFL